MNLKHFFASANKEKQSKEILNLDTQSGIPELLIYDEIAFDDFWGGVSSKSFIAELDGLKAYPQIKVRINSPGGSIFEGLAIYNALVSHPAEIIVQVEGLAASIASIIALAGDKVMMGENSFFMIHNPWSLAIGDSADFRKQADTLDQLKTTLVKTYSAKSAYTEDEISKMMDEETWLDGSQALAAGFADELIPLKGNSAKALVEPGIFKNCPEFLLKTEQKQPENQGKPLDLYKKQLQLLELN